MSPSLEDGPSGSTELPSSISTVRLERLKKVAAQPGMLPVLDCLDALDFALQRVNEEQYVCSESERMRDKATTAVQTKWPGREGDRAPLEETALQSVALLKAQLVQQMEQHPWLRDAIHGDELLSMVQGIAGRGPFKKEDESLREAIRTYVGDTLEQIYKDEEEARAFFNGLRDKEERFVSHIGEISEQLSSDQFLHNRAGDEESRTQVAIQLLSHFLGKAKAAAKRGAQIEEVLHGKLACFEAWHSEQEESYQESELAELSEQGKLQDQLSQLREFSRKHIQEHAGALEDVKKDERADMEELQAAKQKLEALLKSVGKIAVRHQRRCLMKAEKERLFRYVQQSLQEQEVMLRSQLDLAGLLVKRWERGRQLHGQFVGLIRKAYEGMRQVAQQKTEDLRRELELESSKFAALASATDDDLVRQRNKMLVALQKTFSAAKRQEQELELLERSFRPEEQTQQAQTAFRESQECVKRQEEQVGALDQLRETLASKCEDYETALKAFLRGLGGVGSPHSWDEQAHAARQAEVWVQEFFYTVRRPRLQMPQVLGCGMALMGSWAELGAGSSEQSLRHTASDPSVGVNFAGTGSSDLLAIRDGPATGWDDVTNWSEGEDEALVRIEDFED